MVCRLRRLETNEIEHQVLFSYFIALVSYYLKNYDDAVFTQRNATDFAILIPHVNAAEAEKSPCGYFAYVSAFFY
jgi:hypothetical protein